MEHCSVTTQQCVGQWYGRNSLLPVQRIHQNSCRESSNNITTSAVSLPHNEVSTDNRLKDL
jgi:hypothetical protein